MMLKFVKENNNKWYIDLPQYLDNGGNKEDLRMVAGADTLLNEISNNKSVAKIKIDHYDYDIELKKLFTIGWGNNYSVRSNIGTHTKLIWLCPVTKYVFQGKYPKIIRFKVI